MICVTIELWVKKCAQARLKKLSTKYNYLQSIYNKYDDDLALNNLQWLMCHKTQTKPSRKKTLQRKTHDDLPVN